MAEVIFDQAYFDSLYRQNPDPWDFRRSDYEKKKYAATLAALPRDRYAHVLELGCSIGELTRRLATRAGQLTAVDTSAVALTTAREACREHTNIAFVQAHLPDGDWECPADAVVLSEVLYYLDADAVRRLAERIVRCAPMADLVLVHWTGETNYAMTGDEATATFLEAAGPARLTSVREPAYRLDVLTRDVAR